MDGGIRRGTDVVKALCLGAKGVGLGRPALWGLGAGGVDGVKRTFESRFLFLFFSIRWLTMSSSGRRDQDGYAITRCRKGGRIRASACKSLHNLQKLHR